MFKSSIRNLSQTTRTVTNSFRHSSNSSSSSSGYVAVLYKNRQALMNIMAMGLMMSYAVHNYELKVKWDEREKEFVKIQDQLKTVHALTEDKDWLSATENGIKWRSTTLQKELLIKLEPPKELTPIEKVQLQQDELKKIQQELGTKLL